MRQPGLGERQDARDLGARVDEHRLAGLAAGDQVGVHGERPDHGTADDQHVASSAPRRNVGGPKGRAPRPDGWLARPAQVEKDDPQPQVLLAFGLLNLNPAPCSPTT